MSFLPSSTDWLTESHRRRLAWFADRAGELTGFPGQMEDGSYLVSTPKGIYKPKDLEYALSVRTNRDSSYVDGKVNEREDGSWYFAYHQEGADPQRRDREFTNRALIACIRDEVPVGVLAQEHFEKGRSQYRVLGLAVPVDWQNGYFYFESTQGPEGSRGDTVADVMIVEAEAEAET